MTLLEFALVSEKAIKKFFLGGGGIPPGGLGRTTILEFAIVSENAIKKFWLGVPPSNTFKQK